MFITFEGIDGSGKTTVINKIIKLMQTHYPQKKFVVTREPGGMDLDVAEAIREIILNPNYEIDALSEAVLFAASRRIHLQKVILPALKENKIVFCDRYVDSSLAYQGGGGKQGIENIMQLNELVIDNTWPELTFLFKISPEEAYKRILEANAATDRIENKSLDFFKRVSETYEKLAKDNPQRFVIINAEVEPENVFQQVKKVLEARVLNAK